MPEPSADLVAGRYRLVSRIAAGGMGEIFLAVQDGPQGFQKLVALKRILSRSAEQKSAIQHFLDEAQLTSRLTHRNIAQVFDFGQDRDGYFVAMELVQGVTVATLLDRLSERGQRLSPAVALDVAAQVAEALAYAWETPGPDGTPLNVVHRDISPQNVMVSVSGDVKVIDFGVAKSNQQLHATMSGLIKGKMAYMSPEQSCGDRLDTRSDLFSLGIVLCQMLTGAHPFARTDLLQVMAAIRFDPPMLPSKSDPALGPLDATLSRLLAKDPPARFADGHEVAEVLQVLRASVAPAPTRLGALVREHFGAELDALVFDVRIKTPTPGPVSATVATVATLARERPAETMLSPLTPSVAAPAPQPSPRIAPERTAPRRGWGGGPWVAGTLLLVSAGTLGGWWFARSDPLPNTTVVVGPAEPPGARSGTTPSAPTGSPPPGSTTATSPASTEAPPAESKAGLASRTPPGSTPSDPGTQTPAPVRPKPKPAQAAVSGDRAKVPPAPVRVLVSLPHGKRELVLRSDSGTVKLLERAGWTVYLDYSTSGGGLEAMVRSEPWAIAAIDGVSIGKTPVALPPFLGKTLDLDLRNPGTPPLEFGLSARR